MAEIKSYTDLRQSKKLEGMLPIKSADMHSEAIEIDGDMVFVAVCGLGDKNKSNYGSPIWSLAALLDVLPDEITDDGDVFRNMFFHLKGKYIIQYPRLTTLWPSLLSVEADNPIDACVEMIIKLNEQKLL